MTLRHFVVIAKMVIVSVMTLRHFVVIAKMVIVWDVGVHFFDRITRIFRIDIRAIQLVALIPVLNNVLGNPANPCDHGLPERQAVEKKLRRFLWKNDWKK